MNAIARRRLDVKVYGRCSEMEWQRTQRMFFRAKRRNEARQLAVRLFRAVALVVAAFAGFCAAGWR